MLCSIHISILDITTFWKCMEQVPLLSPCDKYVFHALLRKIYFPTQGGTLVGRSGKTYSNNVRNYTILKR